MQLQSQASNASTNPENSSQASRPSTQIAVIIGIVLILLLGGYFRFVGINWDNYTHLHPDERFLTIVTAKLERPGSFLNYMRTSESTLNPYNKGEGFFVYGNFPMTATFYVGQALNWAQSNCAELSESIWCRNSLTGYDGVHLVGRLMSALVDLIAVLFTFMIGRRLYGNAAGLLAAFFMATAVMPIQQSHFYTMDNWAAAFSTITIYAAVRASENARPLRWWVIFGAMLGLTVASRINVAPIALLAGVAGVVWLYKQFIAYRLNYKYVSAENGTDKPREPEWLDFLFARRGILDLQTILIGGIIAALISMAVFRVAQPYAFADSQIAREAYFTEHGSEPGFLRLAVQGMIGFNPTWLSNLEEIQRLQEPESSFPPALQWTDRPAIIFPLVNMLLYGMGPIAGVLAWVGFMVALWQIVRGRASWVYHAIPVFWIALYFLFIGTRWVKSIRYFLPIYPILFVLAGWLIVHLWQRATASEKGRLWGRYLAAGTGVLALLTSFLWANAFVEIYRQPLTRVAASEWIYENVPTAVTVFYDTNDTIKQLQLPLTGIEMGSGMPALPVMFELPEDGSLVAVKLNYVNDPEPDNLDDNEVIQIGINGQPGLDAWAEATVGVNLDDTRRSVQFDFAPVPLKGNERHAIFIEPGQGSGPFRLGTSVISSEHWDDALPTRLNGRDPFSQYYRGIGAGQMSTTHPDSNQKREELYQWINDADYIVISSQRSLWSLPRLPLTYPLMVGYYESLFSGELGFTKVAEFHGDIRVGPLYISDTGGALGWQEPPEIGWPPPSSLAAEEAFSVYDHPPVWVFRKNDNFSEARVQEVLGSIDLNNVIVMNPLEATNAPNGLMLTEEQQAQQRAGGTFSELFNPDGILSQNGFVAAVVWWLTIVIIGWITFPITFVVFRNLHDRGYALSRILGVLIISYFGWILASVNWLPFTSGTLALGVLTMLTASLIITAFKLNEMRQFVRENWQILAFVEAWAIVLFLLQIVIRLGNPDAWHVIWGGEKPMDMSYFTAVLKSSTFPPYDPWLAGGYINYYYYGFVYVGAITKLLGIVPAMAYNLILPMLYSFTGTGVFSLAYNLVMVGEKRQVKRLSPIAVRPVAAGIIATVFAVVLGNLRQVGVMFGAWQRAHTLTGTDSVVAQIAQGGWRILSGQTTAPIYPGDWFWTATRAIAANEGEVAPITEFPFFTFLYGDLHAHMIALPLALLALGWAVSIALTPRDAEIPGYQMGLQWFIGALAIGVLYPVNSWDYPTYLVIAALAIVYHIWQRDGWTWTGIGQAATLIAALFALSMLTFWPFWSNFGTGYATMRTWPGSYTTVADYLAIHGLFLIVVITYLFIELKVWAQTLTPADLERHSALIIIGVVGAFVLIPVLFWGLIAGYEVLPLALLGVIVAGLLGVRRESDPERRIANVLISSAMGLTLFVEIFVLDGDIGRMNTVFKFYMQVWVIFSIIAATALIWIWPRINSQWGEVGRRLWKITLVTAVMAASLYPILATRAKWIIRENRDVAPVTLDGMAFMEYVSYGDSGQTVTLQEDYDAIQWMHRNIEGSPVIVEAHSGNPYRTTANRVTMYTGLPSVVGWDWHQRQQRNTVPGSVVSRRIQDVSQLYTTDNSEIAMTVINRYDIEYIYAGQQEILYYGLAGILKFDQMVEEGRLEEVYRNRGVSIYRVIEPPPAASY